MSDVVTRLLALPETAPRNQFPSPRTGSGAAGFLGALARAYRQKVAPTLSDAMQPRSNFHAPDASTNSYRDLTVAAARNTGVAPALLLAVVEAESGFNPHAVSLAGAKGMTQLMDGTARSLGVTDSFDPWQNLIGGGRFLRDMIDRYHGDVSLALAAYNAGPSAVDHAGKQIPPYAETQTYVRRVLSLYDKYSWQLYRGGRP